MKIIWLLIFLLPCLASSQTKSYVNTDPIYIRNVDAADEFFEAGSYREAIRFYLNALQITEEAFRSNYRLATCYLHLREFASANTWLQKCADQHPAEFCELVLDEDSELFKYRPFLKWPDLQVACLDAMPFFDLPLKKELVEIRYFDQFIRSENRTPNEADCVGKKQYWPGMTFHQVDSVNQVRVRRLIARRGGYPGLDIVGESQKSTVWLVIQHAPIEMQEEFYPLVEQAANEGQITKGNWAYLVDRMRMNRGEKQVYGSQLRLKKEPGSSEYEVYPLEDPFNVNQRRAAVGLGPIEDYISGWGLKFEPEKMQKD